MWRDLLRAWRRAKNTAILIALLCALLAGGGYVAPSMAAEAGTSGRYVVTLMSSQDPIKASDVANLEVLRPYRLYITLFRDGNVTWYRLRVGFFPTAADAKKLLAAVRGQYPLAWIAKVTKAEVTAAPATEIKIFATPEAPVGRARAQPEELPETPAGKLLREGRRAMTDGQYQTAIKIFSELLEAGQGPEAQEARELLGLARERLGQNDLARVEYQAYLALYPKGEGAERVRQRLAALSTAQAAATKPLKPFEEQKKSDISGSFSQFSHRDILVAPDGTLDNFSALFSYLDVTGRYRGERVDIRSQISTSFRYDFNTTDVRPDQLRLSAFYLDVRDRDHGLLAVLGRQSASSGGVLGRFDGALLGFRPRQRWRINIVGGYPVDLSSTATLPERERHFASINLDMGTFANYWDFNVYVIQQLVGPIVDRFAVGGEVRYSAREQTYLTLVDYDIDYNTLNSFLTVGNWFLPGGTTLNAVYDYRTAPVLTTTSALIGQPEPSIAELLLRLTEPEVRQLAQDRTAVVRTVTLGAAHPLNSKLQINGDVVMLNQGGTVASGGVAEVVSFGTEYAYSANLIGSNLMKEGDIVIFGLRYANGRVTDTSSLNFNLRYPLTRAWRANPALGIDYRANETFPDQLSVRPSIRIDYRWLTAITFDAETGILWTTDVGSNSIGADKDFFFELGYRIDF